MFAGILLAAALVFAVPSKADTVDFTISGAVSASFSLPDTLTPSATLGSIVFVFNPCSSSAPCTLLGGPPKSSLFGTIDLGNTGTGTWSFGSTGHTMNGIVFPGPELGIFVAGLFNTNPDGTITINAGSFSLTSIVGQNVTLTTTVIPDGSVGVPEPATLALLGIGGLALAGIRRRKTA
jgi:hypothetical protein